MARRARRQEGSRRSGKVTAIIAGRRRHGGHGQDATAIPGAENKGHCSHGGHGGHGGHGRKYVHGGCGRTRSHDGHGQTVTARRSREIMAVMAVARARKVMAVTVRVTSWVKTISRGHDNHEDGHGDHEYGPGDHKHGHGNQERSRRSRVLSRRSRQMGLVVTAIDFVILSAFVVLPAALDGRHAAPPVRTLR